MNQPRPHKHLIIDASIRKPCKDEQQIKELLEQIIEHIGMNLAKLSNGQTNPIGWYCEDKGNEGMTATAILTTSHITVHMWDRCDPSRFHFDLYSCSDYEEEEIISMLDYYFDFIKGHATVLDRDGQDFNRFNLRVK